MPIRHFVVKLAGAGFLISSAAASAAAVDTSQGPLDEIVVTASKRDEKLHDVAMSVTAIGSDQLALRQETGFLDWAAQVPGLSLQTSDPAFSRLIIRGENVGSVGAQVATTVDDIPFFMSGAQADGAFFSANVDTYDLQRIEVLRGPQGTLYGAAAEGGIINAAPGYLAGLRRLCDDTGTLLIFDEVQTGCGRTGHWFGHQYDDVTPDVMTLAKGLGGGIPIGAMCASEKAAAGLAYHQGGAVPHASTFGGNPFACAAASAVFDIIETEGLIERVNQASQYLGKKLAELVVEFPGQALEVRGRGLLMGLVVANAPANVTGACRAAGLLCSVAGDKVVRFAPPYIVSREQLDEAVGVVRGVLATGAGK